MNKFDIKLCMLLPKCVVQYIFINYLDINSISKTIYYYPKLFNDNQKNTLERIKKGFIYCCSNGYLREAELIYSLENVCRDDINIAFVKCCYRGHISVAKWIYGLGKNRYARDGDYIDTDKTYDKNYITTKLKDGEPFFGLYDIEIPFNNQGAFYISCERGHMEIAKWLFSIDKNIDIHFFGDYCFQVCCYNGYLECAKWLHSLENMDLFNNQFNIFEECCKYGNIDIAKWLYSINNNLFITSKKKVFITACSNGHTKLAKWLYSLDYDITEDTKNSAFMKSCKNEHYNTIHWLLSLNINIDCLNKAFITSCMIEGNIEIVELLYPLIENKEIIKISLINTCRSQTYFDIFKWLYSVNDINMNVIEEIFVECSKYGTDGTAKWIYSLNTNINDNIIVKAFNTSCNNSLPEMAQWLYSLRICINTFIIDLALIDSVEKLLRPLKNYKNNNIMPKLLKDTIIPKNIYIITEWLYSISGYKNIHNTEFNKWILNMANLYEITTDVLNYYINCLKKNMLNNKSFIVCD